MLINNILQAIQNIDVSNNEFEGRLYGEPFLIPTLVSFAATSNCLYGKLPLEICGADNLEVSEFANRSASHSIDRNAVIVSLLSNFQSDTGHGWFEYTIIMPKQALESVTYVHLRQYG
jgi:hypothetical protein